MMNQNNQGKIYLIILLFSIMAVIGFIGNLRGVLLPEIKKDLGVNYTNMGILFFLSSLGYFVATLSGGLISDRIGQKKILAIGFIFAAIGVVGIKYSFSFSMLLITMSVLNIGFGCFDISINSLAPKVFTANTAVMMSMMHVFFGLGSAAGPKTVDLLFKIGFNWNDVYFASFFLIAAVWILFIFSPPMTGTAAAVASGISIKSLGRDKRLWLFIGVLGFCESTELGFCNWLVNFLRNGRGLSTGISAQYMFYFFLIYTIGRVFGGFIVEKFGYVRTLISFVSITVILIVAGLYLGGSWSILFSLTGFSISIMFPTVVTLIAKEFPNGTSSALGVIMTSAGLISITSNWVIGRMNDVLGVLAGFGMIPVFALFVIVTVSVLNGFLTFKRTRAGKSVLVGGIINTENLS